MVATESVETQNISRQVGESGPTADEATENKATQAGEKLSANERRRLRRAEEAEQKRKEKAEKNATAGNVAPSRADGGKTGSIGFGGDVLDASKYYEMRVSQLAEFQKNGGEIYPHKFFVSMSLPDYHKQFAHLSDGEHMEDKVVTVAGRIQSMRSSSAKLKFYDLHGDQTKIQIAADLRHHDENARISFATIHDLLRRGDVVGVRGFPGKSKRGELSIFPREIVLLSPCLHMLPDNYYGMRDQETRYRQRYLDMLVNPKVKDTFLVRNKVIGTVRSYLTRNNFVEVETPTLQMIYGGAQARPFKTKHNDLDMQLYMRISPELFLKELIVGGMDRVFEIGKNFRNEGIDLTHNPEFTACEFYMAYADYNDVQRMTEEMVAEMCMNVHGTYKIKVHPLVDAGGEQQQEEVELDFTPPYPRLPFIETIEERAGVKLPRPLDSEGCVEVMKELCAREKIELPVPCTANKLLDKLCGFFIEDRITSPTFIADHPQVMSPLAKWHRDKPEVTERCELFILGREVANFYTEMNHPHKQRATFMRMAEDRAKGDDEACPIDENFCRSLEYGLPPTGGWGMGLDRMTMFMSDNFNIKEVILFPTMRPLEASAESKSPIDVVIP